MFARQVGTEMTISVGTRLGPYEVQSPLGAGGMGEVWKARDTRLERTVAVKVLQDHLASSPDVRQRFEREAKTISALSHPHICALYDVGEAAVEPAAGAGREALGARRETAESELTNHRPAPSAERPIMHLVMEYLEGETLSERLAKGPLPPDQLFRYGIGTP